MSLSEFEIESAITEIGESAEVGRRALAKRRQDIYRDGGKSFLIEQIRREFSEDAVKEMRLAPVNLLKKIVNKRSAIYKRPPLRLALDPVDQPLVSYYEKSLKLNTLMQKINRYYTLQANTAIYCRPMGNKLVSTAVTPYLYSLMAGHSEKSNISGVIFNNFTESGQVTPSSNLTPATGNASYSQEPGTKMQGDVVASNESPSNVDARRYVFWTTEEHFTANCNGEKYLFEGMDPTDPEIFQNPIQKIPVVILAKDRDNEVWASQGEDMVDLTIAIQMGWTDLLTIAKHQGFGTLTVISEEEPKKLTVGVNRAVWLKQTPNGPTPSISYVQANSPLTEYKDLLMELLGLLLTTNDMEPQAISGGKATAQNYTSGFHALIAMSDNLEAIEMDKPAMLEAEKEHFEIIKRWHNMLFDLNALEPEVRALGRFSDKFGITVVFADVKPLESEDEKLNRIKLKTELKLMTRSEALRVLNPDLTDEQLAEKLNLIDTELKTLRDAMVAPSPEADVASLSGEEQEPETEDETGETEDKEGDDA